MSYQLLDIVVTGVVWIAVGFTVGFIGATFMGR